MLGAKRREKEARDRLFLLEKNSPCQVLKSKFVDILSRFLHMHVTNG